MLNGRIALAGSVITTSKLNLRQGSPDSKASIVRKLPSGYAIKVASIVGGENVQGNALWYEIDEGFVWSGGCSGVTPAPAAADVKTPPQTPAATVATDLAASLAPRIGTVPWAPWAC